MASFEIGTALAESTSDYDVAAEAVLISLIAVLAKQSENANSFIWEIENEVKERLSLNRRQNSLSIAQGILSAVRAKALK
ncbi:hypothetical protein [Xenorhabdus griffiniae]|uniref:Uncharacterized protein n=1 Tax=Xenorhabdus griffiniae TaxID=351672 RepID=A0ABY9XDP0_9GAMM|nr:hypothetical protein [Xenorhabdus griffiniae]MBD1229636.1 hypothetical protein [Xenorhabdus griffiniae]WMV70976.1 hypothetical protein QL128_12275 [Xenorhabdus griffiniae]WMV73519.1 hypothetical protein QL128_05710 [Xenorhabdus griffiniae]WMV74024.1 hypothetical protein QL128_08520 [Xenorhabdus griffiniae]WNH00652.1 hypothetical protein QL112_012280 [Xenorhabdus griffiniae]